MSRPGRNRPSFSRYSAELEVRDEEEDEEGGFGRGGSGEVAVAKSRVAASSVSETGRPHDEQKAALVDKSLPQVEHFGMKNSRYSLNQLSEV